MKSKGVKAALFSAVAVIIIMLAVNFTVPEKLIHLRVDNVTPERVEYTVISWSVRPFITGFSDEDVFVFRQSGDSWEPLPSNPVFHHDIAVINRPFCRFSYKYDLDEPLEPGVYKMRFEYYMKGSKTAECVFEVGE
ncbi:MAG: hypothetical protein IKT31_07800 [Firmicutes bacterium]|nr:hypothetical protein [Bacillota bacterium]